MDSILVGVTNIPLQQLSAISAALAITSHFTFFSRSERDPWFRGFFLSSFLIPIALFSTFHFYLSQSLIRSSLLTGTLFGSFLVGLFTSIFVYRVFFHPLRNFPGPFWAKTSKWWIVYTQWKTGYKFHHYCRELHKHYGDIVRIGPNDLSIINPDILPVLSKAEKGPWYYGGGALISLQSTRNKKTHAIRKRVWEKAFTVKEIPPPTTSALQGYVPRIGEYSDLLLSNISANVGKPMNMTSWFSYFTFDFMGDLAFGKSFGLLEAKGKNGSDRWVKTMHRNMKAIGTIGNVTWFFRLLQWLPGMSGAHGEFETWCNDRVEERKQFTPKNHDIFHFLLDAEPNNKAPHHIDLGGDSRLAVIAGSDTTAATFINIFSQLSNSPRIRQKLQDEIDAAYGAPYDSANESEAVPEAILNGGTAATRYLESVINEGLRLNPAVPSGVQRLIPEGGVTIGGRHIPGGACANYAIYAGQASERSFPDPLKFMPERWYELDQETTAKQRAAFAPFWIGSYACVGKSLALLELRIVTSKILRRFDVEFAKGFTIDKVYDSSFDTFTLTMGGIDLVFKPRGST